MMETRTSRPDAAGASVGGEHSSAALLTALQFEMHAAQARVTATRGRHTRAARRERARLTGYIQGLATAAHLAHQCTQTHQDERELEY